MGWLCITLSSYDVIIFLAHGFFQFGNEEFVAVDGVEVENGTCTIVVLDTVARPLDIREIFQDL